MHTIVPWEGTLYCSHQKVTKNLRQSLSKCHNSKIHTTLEISIGLSRTVKKPRGSVEKLSPREVPRVLTLLPRDSVKAPKGFP